MKKNRVLWIAAAAVMMVATCCGKSQETIPEWPWEDPVISDPDPEPEPEPEPEDGSWKDVSRDYAGLPGHVKVYRSPEKMMGKKAIAYIATVDTKVASFGVWGIEDPQLNGSDDDFRTPKEQYDGNGKAALVLNGGYFYASGGKTYASSLAVSEGKLLSPNINYASEDWVSIYYPTRAVFVEHNDGSYEAAWTYFATGGGHWLYQQPADNSWDKKPLAVPSATFPCEGASLDAKNAIGGGPVLIKNGEVVNSIVQELWNGKSGIMPEESHPRSAIGYTADGKLVLFACEGREMTPEVYGFSTGEVAEILKDFGCVEAMNLDGGGSTCLLVGGVETVQPSDGHERSVGSLIFVK